MPDLSNIRAHVGWMIGQTVVDITSSDPPDIPDCDASDEDEVTVQFANGGTLTFYVDEGRGFSYCDPNEDDDPRGD